MGRSKAVLASSVCGCDAFAELSFAAQALYLRLNFECDNMGALGNVRSVMRAGGFEESALDELVDAGFVFLAENDFDRAYFIVHYWVSNKIDRRNFYRNSDHLELATSKFVFKSERTREYVPNSLFADSSDCLQSGRSLLSVLEASPIQCNSIQSNVKESNPKQGNGEGATPTKSGNPTAPCPKCGAECIMGADGLGGHHGWCYQCNLDFAINADGEIYPEEEEQQ